VKHFCNSSFKYFYNFHNRTVHLDNIKVIHSPTDSQVNCLENSFKIYITLTLKQFRHVSVQSEPSSGSAFLLLAKVTVNRMRIKRP